MLRTHTCGELTAKQIKKQTTLCGWVHRRRDHGGIIFIDLRDRYGLTQIVFDPAVNKQAHEIANHARPEYVLKATGTVRPRPKGQENPAMKTGEIEVYIQDVEILNKAKTPPFEIGDEKGVNEELRLKYRYLDLRHERLQKNLLLRHGMFRTIREFMSEEGFIEIETPILIKGTPEGSREYLVPSRLYPGQFYVLPQSPQQLKQLSMIAGFDRYFQIPRCFRDEDQRGDRQPEFTQLDVEMSFVEEEDVRKITEELIITLTKKHAPQKKILKVPFPVLTYQEAMERFGSDKPDIRFAMEMVDISDIVKKCGFKVFSGAVAQGGTVKALRVEGAASMARREIDELEEVAKAHGAKGLAYFVYSEEGIKSPILKFLSESEVKEITERTGAIEGDIVFFSADQFEVACTSLGQVRLACGRRFKLIDESIFAYLWVHEFPLFECKEDGTMAAMHHPFTRPMEDDLEVLDSHPEKTRAVAYDIVLNGVEVGGGSIRIHEAHLQERIFHLLKITPEDAERRFGHMLEAFQYGAPPHGGIAWGLDRLVMLFANEPNIREVIAFPKDQKAKDLMLGAPSVMPEETLIEANIEIRKK